MCEWMEKDLFEWWVQLHELVWRTFCSRVPANLCKPTLLRCFIEVCLRKKPQSVWNGYHSTADGISIRLHFRLCTCFSVQVFHAARQRGLTSLEDDAVVGDFVPRLQAGAVPAVALELVLALVDGDLDSLDGGGRHVWVPHAHLQLAPRQTGQRQTHRVGVKDGLDVWQLQAQDFIRVHPAWRSGYWLTFVSHWSLVFSVTASGFAPQAWPWCNKKLPSFLWWTAIKPSPDAAVKTR